MADIKKAAEWMQQGKRVTRTGYRGFFTSDEADFVIYSEEGLSNMLDTESLLADDWEIDE